jgi:hypothetical protein
VAYLSKKLSDARSPADEILERAQSMQEGWPARDPDTRETKLIILYSHFPSGPLLWDLDPGIRLDAVECNQVATDLPFLMLALRDKTICFKAYQRAMWVIRSLGAAEKEEKWETHKDEANRILWDWWTDELNGKHQPVPPAPPALPTATPDLYPYLYFPVAQVREQALEKVTASADRTSVPYLVLALQDPDPVVSYGAYVLLHRLLKALGPARTRPEFEANRDAETQPIYAWWQDELAGLHHPAAGPGAPVPPAGK